MESEEFVGNTEKEGKRIFPVWVSILLFVVIFLVLTLFLVMIAQGVLFLTVGKGLNDTQIWSQIAAEISMLLAVLVSAIIMLRLEQRPFSDLGLSLKGRGKDLMFGALVAALLYLIGFGGSLALGEIEVIGYHIDITALIISWMFFLLVALMEEIMMRGFVLGHLLQTRLNKFISLFISAVMFALMHIFNPNIAFLPMLNLVLAGMLLGASYLYTRNLCFPITLHLFWNWIQGPILGYQVSGTEFGTTLLELYMPEENVLNGGAFGFEGSLICTFLMIVFTIAIVWWGEKREAINLVKPQSY